MNNHMKFLIGTACFCVIGLTAWFVISEVRSNQRQQSFANVDKMPVDAG